MHEDMGERVKGYMKWSRVSRLPDTKEFAEGLKKRYGDEVKVLTGADASESRLWLEELRIYGLSVLLAIHGIIDERLPYMRQAALLLSNPLVIGEPMKVRVRGKEREIDGYLTMSEVMEMKMRPELVGALACHSGEGGIEAGEGVMHLGRAFQYAGARSVLVSLWGVAGESTNLLAERLLEGIRGGKDKDEALLEARKSLREAGYEHPFYWASFILIGERNVVRGMGGESGVDLGRYAWLLVGVVGAVIVLLVGWIGWMIWNRRWKG